MDKLRAIAAESAPRWSAKHEPQSVLRLVPVGRPSLSRAGPSPEFVARGRNISLAEAAVRERPRFEPTPKSPGDIIL